MHQKEAHKVQNLVEDIETNEERLENSLKTCSSAVLASQIKKIIPSKAYENRKSSIAVGLEKVNIAIEQKKSKIVEAQSLSEESSIPVTEIAQTDSLLVPQAIEEAVDPNIIKILPVPLPEKKIFRDMLTLPPSKVPWKDKVFEKDHRTPPPFAKNLVSNHSKMSEKDIVKYCRKKYFAEINEAKTKSFIDNLQNLLQGTGWMEPTIMFLGNYPIAAVSGGFVYNVPLAFVLVFIAIYLFCFIMMMAYSSFGVYEAIMSKEYSAPRFANDVFSGWDYCIQGSRNAEIHHRSFTNNIRTTLSEIVYKKEAEARSRNIWIKLYCIRFLVNLSVIALISGGYYMIFTVVHLQLREENYPYHPGLRTLMVQYLPALSVTTIRMTSPLFFSFVTRFEKFHARTTVNLSLARSAFIGLSSVVVLVASFQHQILCQPVDICGKGRSHCHAPMCWETYVGQELYKLNVSEFLVSLFFFFLNAARNYTKKKFDNRITRWIGTAEFFLPQEILALIYLQTITWLGALYSPLLPLTLVLKFTVLFYTKKTIVMKYARPSTTIYKASRFNSMYILISMISFLIVVAIQFYTFRKVTPSYGCSPFRYYDSMSEALTKQLEKIPHLLQPWRLLLTGWFFVPAYIFLCFLIYYNWRRCSILRVSVSRLTQELIMLGEDRQFLLQKIAQLVEKDEKNL